MGPVPDDHCDSMADDEGTGPTIESYAGRSRINAGKLGLQGVEGGEWTRDGAADWVEWRKVEVRRRLGSRDAPVVEPTTWRTVDKLRR